jgi:membrane-associated protein
MEFVSRLVDGLLHPDKLNDLATWMGPWFYVVMFSVIFAETGLVVAPFLPGDSLLFGLGAVAAKHASTISLPLLAVLLVMAAVLGDAVNYLVGYWVGPRVFASEKSRFLNKKHLLRAHAFYETHGGKTIILARFVPVIRTFAPFVAGIGEMSYLRFAAYNVVGGAAWILLFLLGGFAFGKQPWVEKNFHYVIAAIIVISVLPAFWEFCRARAAARRGESALVRATTLAEDPSKV